MRALLDDDPFGTPARSTARVELSRTDGRWMAVVQRLDAAEVEQGTQQLTSTASTCDEVYQATIAALAVLLGTASAAPPAAAADQNAPPSPPPSAPSSVPRATAAQPAAPQREPGRPAPSGAPSEPGAPLDETAPPRTPPRAHDNLLGLGVAVDLVALADTRGVCGNDAFDCTLKNGDEFRGVPAAELGNRIAGGLSGVQGRVLIVYGRQVTDHVALEARAGFVALGRAREAFPAHLEVGANYWLSQERSLGRAFVGVSLGLSSFDTTLETSLVDCATPQYPEGDPGCPTTGQPTVVDAVRRTGLVFGGGAFGGALKLSRRGRLLLRNAAFLTYPHTVVVIEPSLAYGQVF